MFDTGGSDLDRRTGLYEWLNLRVGTFLLDWSKKTRGYDMEEGERIGMVLSLREDEF